MAEDDRMRKDVRIELIDTDKPDKPHWGYVFGKVVFEGQDYVEVKDPLYQKEGFKVLPLLERDVLGNLLNNNARILKANIGKVVIDRPAMMLLESAGKERMFGNYPTISNTTITGKYTGSTFRLEERRTALERAEKALEHEEL